MDRIRLVGGHELRGEIPISGAKNAALPLMIASLLTKDPLVLENVPRLADVNQLEKILENHGVDIAVHGRKAPTLDGQRMTLQAAEIVDTTAPYELVHVCQPRDILQHQRVLGQQRGDHQRQSRVLGTRDGNLAPQFMPTDQTNAIHVFFPTAEPSAPCLSYPSHRAASTGRRHLRRQKTRYPIAVYPQ